MTQGTDPKGTPAPRSRRLPVAITLGAVALLAILVLSVGSTPAACGSCHAMNPYATSLKASEHKGIDCYTCHVAGGAVNWPGFKTRELTVMYPLGLIGRKVTGPGRRVTRENCVSCHGEVLREATESKGLRIVHAACAADAECGSCHGATAHGRATRWVRQVSMEECVACHLDSQATVECDRCHAAKREAERLARGPWQVTHGPKWRDTHGMGVTTTCATCHPSGYCARCHGVDLPHSVAFGGDHGDEAQRYAKQCLDCHDRTTFCDACHGVKMPHGKDFLERHSSIAKSDDDETCLRCHYEDDCAACHARHTHPGSTDGTLGGSKFPEAGK